MVALTTLNLPIEAWKSARLLRAVPNCRLVLMLAYHMLSPALSVEENGFNGVLTDATRSRPICSSSDIWTSELEVRRKEIGGDRRETSYSNATASVIHQDALKAFGSKQD